MKAGILAAGWGRRLGCGPKALAKVAGRPLIDRVIEGLVDAGATEITCIVNEQGQAVCDHVERAWPAIRHHWIVRSTPTSMHSFLLVLEQLAVSGEAGYLLTTVDSVSPCGTTRAFARAASSLAVDLALGVTDVIDDEKPLYAVPRLPGDAGHAVEREGARAARIRRVGAEAVAGAPASPFEVSALTSAASASRFVTAGLYWASPAILALKDASLDARFTALRQFLGQVVTTGHRCWAVPLPPVVDVDRPADVAAAERLVS
jgi:NDP-sugar pyrophosphorylase family protein